MGMLLVGDHINLDKRIYITRQGQVVSNARKFALEGPGLVHNIWIHLNVDGK